MRLITELHSSSAVCALCSGFNDSSIRMDAHKFNFSTFFSLIPFNFFLLALANTYTFERTAHTNTFIRATLLHASIHTSTPNLHVWNICVYADSYTYECMWAFRSTSWDFGKMKPSRILLIYNSCICSCMNVYDCMRFECNLARKRWYEWNYMERISLFWPKNTKLCPTEANIRRN